MSVDSSLTPQDLSDETLQAALNPYDYTKEIQNLQEVLKTAARQGETRISYSVPNRLTNPNYSQQEAYDTLEQYLEANQFTFLASRTFLFTFDIYWPPI